MLFKWVMKFIGFLIEIKIDFFIIVVVLFFCRVIYIIISIKVMVGELLNDVNKISDITLFFIKLWYFVLKKSIIVVIMGLIFCDVKFFIYICKF